MDFAGLAADLLLRAPEVLRHWFPEGHLKGREFRVGNLRGDPGRSLSINIDTGAWSDFATGEKGGDLIALYAARDHITQGEAFRRLAPSGLKPRVEAIPTLHSAKLGNPTGSWAYKKTDGQVAHYVARYDENGEKTYLPWTWDGKAWVTRAPSARILYGLDLLAQDPEKWVVVAEGEKACDAVRKLLGETHVALTWPLGAGSWHRTDWTPLHGRTVVLWPDADPPGIEAMSAIAEHLVERGSTVSVLDVGGLPDKFDAADALADGWDRGKTVRFIDERARPVSGRVAFEPDTSKRPLGYVRFDEIQFKRDLPRPIVRGLISPGDLVCAYGPPGAGKSVFAADLAFHVAAGLRWFNRTVDKCPVMIVAAESPISWERRLIALQIANKLGSLPITFTTQSISLLDPEGLKELICAAQAPEKEFKEPAGLVVIDTLSRASAGHDENSTETMSGIVRALDAIRSETRAAILILHHSGKDVTKGARGSSVLVAAVDVEIRIVDREATVTKMRDGEAGARFSFGLQSVCVGTDIDDEPYYAPAVLSRETPKKEPKLTGKHTKAAWEAITEIALTGERVAVVDWEQAFLRRATATFHGQEKRSLQKGFQRARDSLGQKGLVHVEGLFARVSKGI